MPFLNSRAPGFENIQKWFNSEPVGIENGVLLLDFWNYSCRGCIGKAEILQRLHDNYEGLEVVGVHSPDLGFEGAENVERALKRIDLDYPVALDSDGSATEDYNAVYSPRQVIVKNGEITWQTNKENLGETEEAIAEALETEKKDLVAAEQPHKDLEKVSLGFQGCKGINGSGNFRGEKRFEKPRNMMMEEVYLDGVWEQKEGCLEAVERSKLFYVTDVSEVNLVIHPNGGIRDVEVLIDGEKVPEEAAGEDLRVEEGRSYMRVKRPDTYHILESDDEGYSEITLLPERRTKMFELRKR